MRLKARKDENHRSIVLGLRDFGASVLDVAQLKNCFDILVGYKGVNYIFEIKNESKPKSQRQLTEGEQKFKNAWKGGEYYIIHSLEEAIKIITK